MFYVYILKSRKSGQWYTGSTGNLRKRLASITQKSPLGLGKGFRGKLDAKARELYLKSGPGKRYLKNRLKRFLSLTG
jgi:putative endonuclease